MSQYNAVRYSLLLMYSWRHATLVSELCASRKLREPLSFNALMANDVCVPYMRLHHVLRDVVARCGPG